MIKELCLSANIGLKLIDQTEDRTMHTNWWEKFSTEYEVLIQSKNRRLPFKKQLDTSIYFTKLYISLNSNRQEILKQSKSKFLFTPTWLTLSHIFAKH